MTGKEIALLWFRKPYEQPCAEELARQIDAAILAERERSRKQHLTYWVNNWLTLLLDWVASDEAYLIELKPQLEKLALMLDRERGAKGG